MTGQPLIQVLDKTLKLHKSLHQLALKKTTIIKEGDISRLNELMKEELKHVSAIQMLEGKRSGLACTITGKKESTLTECLPFLPQGEQKELKLLQGKMEEVLSGLKEQNQLNQQLIEQSMQYVSMNLHLLMPQAESQSYSSQGQEQSADHIKPIFNSKA
ncbi:flagellar protein FlgN [Jeotgalibacillus proteolyticus]|uniref:Flagellar protein FlgN n=1 Tax=Jeotgalibacillus proteolyticus TaxID=2082395 RepID=A0A2S5GB77_9BACL|nr:flagellar protein FlgN [Jeotgalibacillus proteolyticus]PPA70246.1 flagellar protein FlgN [Jeotgalibacillus proteolyticus]